MRHFITIGLLALCATPLAAQNAPAYVLLITGLGGQAAYSQSFHDAAAQIHDAAGRWGVPDTNLVWLGEDPARDRRRIKARATTAAVAAEFVALGRRVRPGEVVLVEEYYRSLARPRP